MTRIRASWNSGSVEAISRSMPKAMRAYWPQWVPGHRLEKSGYSDNGEHRRAISTFFARSDTFSEFGSSIWAEMADPGQYYVERLST